MGFLNTLKPLWQAIKTSPATTPAVLMAWGIPTVCVPLFRFLDDHQRPFHDRLMLSFRDLAAYAVGWSIFLLVTPSIQYGLGNTTRSWAKPWSAKRVGLVSTAIGCVLAAAYSGFGAKRLAQWVTQQWLKPTNRVTAPSNVGAITPFISSPSVIKNAPLTTNALASIQTLRYQPLLFRRYS